jgi:alkylhydroperoxidase/carboxymuconolactone decarboxylase family protein YurZ
LNGGIEMEKNIKTHNINLLEKESPEATNAFFDLVEVLEKKTPKGLDDKTKQLVYIGMKCVLEHFPALSYHIPIAKKHGATRDEIKEIFLLTLTTSGLKVVASHLDEALKAYDEAK